jgi:hypothetical protein
VLVALLAVSVLGAGACSSGSAKQALPPAPTSVTSTTEAFAPTTTAFTTTTPAATTTTTPVATTTTPPLHVVDLADCPRDNPNTSLTRLNTGPDVEQELVPIEALNVRICKYGPVGKSQRLLGISWLALSVAAAFRAETNGLTTTTEPGVVCTGPTQKDTSFFLTFAVDTKTVNLYAGGCPTIASNGTLTAPVSAQWYSELARYTNHVTVAPKAP